MQGTAVGDLPKSPTERHGNWPFSWSQPNYTDS
jgi:hypothetical protein